MKQNSETTKCESARNQKFDPPIDYSFDWTTYVDGPELVAAKDELNVEEQVKVRNAERKAKARAAALNAKLDALGIVKPTIENDEQMRLREMFKILKASGKHTDESARQVASTMLGIEWVE